MSGGSPIAGDLAGTQIGSYRVERRIGAGGMGDVYELLHPGIGKRLAAKILHAEFAARPEISERFFNEARAANLIGHPGIIDVLDHGRLEDGRPYLLMELLEGHSVAELIHRRGALPLGEVQRIVTQVADALGAAHQRGIIHRDLKPDNLFVTRDGNAKVLDFGIAKLSSAVRAGQIPTRTGELLGTPRYMAPEQAAGRVREIDARTDVYAMGAVAYEMLTGRPPFASTTLAQLIEDHIAKRPRPAGELRRDLPAAWSAIVARALAKKPDARFATVRELGEAVSLAPTTPMVSAGPDEATAISPEAATTPVMDHSLPACEAPTVAGGPRSVATKRLGVARAADADTLIDSAGAPQHADSPRVAENAARPLGGGRLSISLAALGLALAATIVAALLLSR